MMDLKEKKSWKGKRERNNWQILNGNKWRARRKIRPHRWATKDNIIGVNCFHVNSKYLWVRETLGGETKKKTTTTKQTTWKTIKYSQVDVPILKLIKALRHMQIKVKITDTNSKKRLNYNTIDSSKKKTQFVNICVLLELTKISEFRGRQDYIRH